MDSTDTIKLQSESEIRD